MQNSSANRLLYPFKVKNLFKGILGRIFRKTKAVFISHITSATGLILPVKEIIEEAKKEV